MSPGIVGIIMSQRITSKSISMTSRSPSTPLRAVVTSVLSPVLIEIGERWHAGTASIAQERMITSTVRKQVGAVIDTYNRIATGPTLVLTTVSGERHEVGLLMGALLASSRGIRCQYPQARHPHDCYWVEQRSHGAGEDDVVCPTQFCNGLLHNLAS